MSEWVSKAAENQVKVQLCDVFMMLMLLLLLLLILLFKLSHHKSVYFLYIFLCFLFVLLRVKLFRTSHTTQKEENTIAEKNHHSHREREKIWKTCDDVGDIWCGCGRKNVCFSVFIVFDIAQHTNFMWWKIFLSLISPSPSIVPRAHSYKSIKIVS